MSGHAYSGENLSKIRHAYVRNNGEFKKLRKAWYYKNGEFKQVWSGASEVSYYDGDTLLGVEEVDEGESVLHPDIDTSKTGYTLVAWKDAKYGDELDELLATGEPMRVYAMYLPNSILVAKSYRYNTDTVKVDVWNSDYMSGSAYVQAVSYGASITNNASFAINLGKYQNSSVKIWSYWYMVDADGYGHDDPNSPISVDGVSRRTGDILTNISGSHTMSAHAFPNWGNGERFVRMNGGLAEVTLSNPTPWT